MPTLVVADIDHHIIDGINLAGLVLGILGSLFFTYDLLGRPGGPLRVFLRVVIPAALGIAILGGIAWAVVAADEEDAAAIAAVALVFAAFGAILGTFNGLFVDAPDGEEKRRRAFYSLRDAGVGLVVTFGFITLALALYDVISAVDLGLDAFSPRQLVSTLGTAVVAGLLAGFWRLLNRSRPQSQPRPRLFSWRGLLIGMVTGLVIPTAALIALFGLSGTGGLSTAFVVGALLFGLLAGVPGGGVTGAISRYMFWWANSLPPRSLEIIGVLLILLGFAAQAVQPILSLLDLTVAR